MTSVVYDMADNVYAMLRQRTFSMTLQTKIIQQKPDFLK